MLTFKRVDEGMRHARRERAPNSAALGPITSRERSGSADPSGVSSLSSMVKATVHDRLNMLMVGNPAMLRAASCCSRPVSGMLRT